MNLKNALNKIYADQFSQKKMGVVEEEGNGSSCCKSTLVGSSCENLPGKIWDADHCGLAGGTYREVSCETPCAWVTPSSELKHCCSKQHLPGGETEYQCITVDENYNLCQTGLRDGPCGSLENGRMLCEQLDQIDMPK